MKFNIYFMKNKDDKNSKICTKCGEEKKLIEFHIGNSSNGRKSRCKECFNKLARVKYKETYIYVFMHKRT